MENFHLTSLIVILAFSILNESIIEYFFGSIKQISGYLPLISLFVAIFLTFIYQINIFAILIGVQSNSPFLDFLLSGFVISRISNFVNDLVQKVIGSK